MFTCTSLNFPMNPVSLQEAHIWGSSENDGFVGYRFKVSLKQASDSEW